MHVHGEKPLTKSLPAQEGRLEGHQPLSAIAFGRPFEGCLYLLACGDRDAALIGQNEGRNGVAGGDGLQVPRGQSLPVADEETSQVFIRWVHPRSSCSVALTNLTATLQGSPSPDPSFGGCHYPGWPVCFLSEANLGSEVRSWETIGKIPRGCPLPSLSMRRLSRRFRPESAAS